MACSKDTVIIGLIFSFYSHGLMSFMAHCASNLIVINSIHEIRTIKKESPGRQTIVKFAGNEYSLSAEDTLNSLPSLMVSKTVYV